MQPQRPLRFAGPLLELNPGAWRVLVRRLGPDPLGLLLLVSGLQGAAEVVVTRNHALGLMFVTPVALLIATSAPAANMDLLAQTRLIDTLWGAGIALAVLGCSALASRDLSGRRSP